MFDRGIVLAFVSKSFRLFNVPLNLIEEKERERVRERGDDIFLKFLLIKFTRGTLGSILLRKFDAK